MSGNETVDIQIEPFWLLSFYVAQQCEKVSGTRMLSDFFDATTVHGFAYVHRRNPACHRLLWSILILVGFSISGWLIFEAFQDWDENPVLTTLDTIAAPITETQFPTVTVCPNEYTPPDNWAYLETILNAVHFSCKENCEKTGKIRKDFEFLSKKIVNYYKGFIYQNKLNEYFFELDDTNNINLVKATVDLIKNKSIQMKDFMNWPASKVLNYKPMTYLLQPHIHPSDLLTMEPSQCSDNLCGTVSKNIELLDLVKRKCPFGSFLAQVVSSHTTDKDDLTAFLNNRYLNDLEQLCSFKDGEEFVQNYFKTLGQGLGLNVSLFDLPSILSYPKREFLTNMTYQQSFLFERCKINSGFKKLDLTTCYHHWEHVIAGTLDLYATTNSHPCEMRDNTEQCCFGKLLNQNIGSVMKVMRLAKRRGQSFIDIQDLLKPFTNNSLLGYDIEMQDTSENNRIRRTAFRKEKKKKGKTLGKAMKMDENTWIPLCSKSQKAESIVYIDKSSCTLFEPVITDIGICQSYNAEKSLDYLQKSPFKDAFYQSYETDFKFNKTISPGLGAGTTHKLEFLLHGNNYQRMSLPKVENFKLAITSSSEYFRLRPVMKTVSVGYKTAYTIQPMEIFPTENLKQVPIEKRKCRFPQETQGVLARFKLYSQSACELECNLDLAEKICKCLPWFYPPNPNNPTPLICDIYGNYCFDSLVKESHRKHSNTFKTCNCVPTCNDIQYAINENTVKLDPNTLCNEKYHIVTRFTAWMIERLGPFLRVYNKILRKDLELESDLDMDEEKIKLCKELVENDLAIVTVTFETEKFVRTVKDRKVSFIDKLATLGGTLGLFTGMSILGMAEIVFWLFKGLGTLLGKFKVKKMKSAW